MSEYCTKSKSNRTPTVFKIPKLQTICSTHQISIIYPTGSDISRFRRSGVVNDIFPGQFPQCLVGGNGSPKFTSEGY